MPTTIDNDRQEFTNGLARTRSWPRIPRRSVSGCWFMVSKVNQVLSALTDGAPRPVLVHISDFEVLEIAAEGLAVTLRANLGLAVTVIDGESQWAALGAAVASGAFSRGARPPVAPRVVVEVSPACTSAITWRVSAIRSSPRSRGRRARRERVGRRGSRRPARRTWLAQLVRRERKFSGSPLARS